MTPEGWEFEADPKHTQTLISMMGLDTPDAKACTTPGVAETEADVSFETEEERDEKDPALSRSEERDWRGAGGTAQYLAGDRLDIKFATKEVLRDAADVRASSHKKVKRIARYLKFAPRFVYCYRFQKPTKTLKVGVDANHAGCLRSRKSTTCVIARKGNHILSELSQTQDVVALSSGESEFIGIVRAAIEALYLRNLLRFFREECELIVETDSTAARGAASRIGCGRKLRHVETKNFFLQGLVREGVIKTEKVKGEEHPPDIGTKHLHWPRLAKLLAKLDIKLLTVAGVSVLPRSEASEVASFYAENKIVKRVEVTIIKLIGQEAVWMLKVVCVVLIIAGLFATVNTVQKVAATGIDWIKACLTPTTVEVQQPEEEPVYQGVTRVEFTPSGSKGHPRKCCIVKKRDQKTLKVYEVCQHCQDVIRAEKEREISIELEKQAVAHSKRD